MTGVPGGTPDTGWIAWTQSFAAGTKHAYGSTINMEFYDPASFPDPTCTP
jgi:hypothetical protein